MYPNSRKAIVTTTSANATPLLIVCTRRIALLAMVGGAGGASESPYPARSARVGGGSSVCGSRSNEFRSRSCLAAFPAHESGLMHTVAKFVATYARGGRVELWLSSMVSAQCSIACTIDL